MAKKESNHITSCTISWENTEDILSVVTSVYFPSFYPDGDYYFFIEENFEFGYLGHPWRQEIWIFGRDLIKEIEQVYLELGWKNLN